MSAGFPVLTDPDALTLAPASISSLIASLFLFSTATNNAVLVPPFSRASISAPAFMMS